MPIVLAALGPEKRWAFVAAVATSYVICNAFRIVADRSLSGFRHVSPWLRPDLRVFA